MLGGHRLRERDAAQPVLAMDAGRMERLAVERAGRAAHYRHVLAPEQAHDAARVARDGVDAEIPRHRDHAEHAKFRRAERQEERQGVVEPGVRVDDDANLVPSSLVPCIHG